MRWRVKDGTQVKFDGKLHAAGDTFSATEEQVAGRGLNAYVEQVTESKAQSPSSNKAQSEPEGNKSSSPSPSK